MVCIIFSSLGSKLVTALREILTLGFVFYFSVMLMNCPAYVFNRTMAFGMCVQTKPRLH